MLKKLNKIIRRTFIRFVLKLCRPVIFIHKTRMTMIAASSSADGTLSSYKPLKSAYYNPTEQEKTTTYR